VTICTTVRWVLSSLANGLGTGGMAVVARRIGARNEEAAGHAAGQTILLGLGAAQPERSARSAWWVSAYAACYMAVAAGVLSLLAPSLIALFAPTPLVVTLGAECLRLIAWSEVASAIGVVLARSFGGPETRYRR
jgi:Na+-driven multidrug efflux pump